MGKKALLFYLTIFLLIVAYTINVKYLDFDLWARLIAGMGVIDGGHVLTQDFLSYTPVHTWYDHEWGAGVVFYTVLKFFGQNALILLQAILSFLIFFTASRIVKIRTNQSPYNILFFFFCIMAAMTNLNSIVRCHMFSFLFFTIFIYILEKVRHGANKKLLIILPLLTVLWNNMHGGVVAGIGLISMYIVGEIYNHKPFKEYIYALISSCALLAVNPWGIDYIKFLLHATTMERAIIGEWQGLFSQLQWTHQYTFKVFLFAVFGIEIFKNINSLKNNSITEFWQKMDKVKVIVLLATAYLAVSHVKMLPFFCIAATCYCFEDIAPIFAKVNQKAVYVLLLLISLFTILVKPFALPVNFKIYPVTELEFIRQNNIEGNILVDFGLGSYTSYKLYPHNKIYMDGRYEEVYPDELLVLNDKFFASKAGWDDILYKYPPDIVVVQANLPVYKLMQRRTDWRRIFEGNAFGVFIKSDKYTGNYIEPSLDKNYYLKTLFNTDIKFAR